MTKYIPLFKIFEYAVEHIHEIRSAEEIGRQFEDGISDISAKRHENTFIKTNAARFIGQQNIWFSFNESESLSGEFSVDFLPANPVSYSQLALENISKSIPGVASAIPMRLSNLRAQLFSRESNLPGLQARHVDISLHLTELLDQPNSTSELRELAADLAKASGVKEVMCWKKIIGGKSYLVSGYAQLTPLAGLPYIAFAISEYLSAEGR